MSGFTDPLPERIADKIEPGDCWQWTGSKHRGYGYVFWDGQMRPAHRVIWGLLVDPIHEELQIDHLCLNRACVNPDHLEVVTPAENTRRAPARVARRRERSLSEIRSSYPVRRVTYREAAGAKAWQRQIREAFEQEGTPDVDLSLKQARVERVSRIEAEQIILKYEWLGTMSKSSHHYAIFFDGYCAGVTCVAVGSGTAGNQVHAEWGLQPRELAMLVRGACVHWAPTGANSKLVSWTARLLADDSPQAKLLLAYSDGDAGEVGTIYQACNWVYVGRTAAPPQIVSPEGRVIDGRNISNRAKQYHKSRSTVQRAFIDAGWTYQGGSSKGKYVKVLREDDELAALVESRRLPYPKRAPEA